VRSPPVARSGGFRMGHGTFKVQVQHPTSSRPTRRCLEQGHGKDGKQRTFPTFPRHCGGDLYESICKVCCTCNLDPPTRSFVVAWRRTGNDNGKSGSLRDDKQKNRQRQRQQLAGKIPTSHPSRSAAMDGAPEGLGLVEENRQRKGRDLGSRVRLEWNLEDVWNEWFEWVGVLVGSVVAVVVDYLWVDLCVGAGVVSSDDVKKQGSKFCLSLPLSRYE
jgi:hypothetical protein